MAVRSTDSSRVVIVTGAASGNGLRLTTTFLSRGDHVVAVDVDGHALARALKRDWAAHPDTVLAITADVSEYSAVVHTVDQANSRFGSIDVLINNAGITGGPKATTLHETTPEDFDRVWGVNVRAPFLACRAVLPAMLERRTGTIINVASVAGTVAFPGRAAYSVSKGAVMQLSRSIAVDYASLGVRCNTLCPGMIETPMTRWRLEQPELRSRIVDRIPQGTIGTTRDVAEAAWFLASAEARYINGAALVVDGGYTAV